MRSFLQAVLAVVVVLGIVAAAPRGAEAQECVQRHMSWVASPPAGMHRSERVQVVQTNDTLGWTGHAVATLEYTPSRFTGNFFFPARMSGEGQMDFSDRSWCAQSGEFFCNVYQYFSAWDTDRIRVTFINNLLGSAGLAFRFDALRWGFNHQPAAGTCVNNNTVLYAMPGDVTYLITFTDVETSIPR